MSRKRSRVDDPLLLQQPKRTKKLDLESKNQLWTDKWAPKTPNGILGNQINCRRMTDFLTNWHGSNPKRALLLCGASGTGKSMAVHLVAESVGCTVLEFNAGETRNQKTLDEVVKAASESHGLTTDKRMILMDEVDGMSGHEDRGGLPALVRMIKTTKLPVICTCNDMGDRKMRTLKNHCLVVKWEKPTAQVLVPAMLSIAAREGVRVDRLALERLVQTTQSDVRLILNTLQLWQTSNGEAIKDFARGPFDVMRDLFRAPTMNEPNWIQSRTNAYLADPALVPLFVAENYITQRVAWQPPPNTNASAFELERLSLAADSIADGDILHQHLPQEIHAVVSTIAPGFWTAGSRAGTLGFPSCLGRHSTMRKHARMQLELRNTMFTDSQSGCHDDFELYQLPLLRHVALTSLLFNEKPEEAIECVWEVMSSYALTKDDFASMIELTDAFAALQYINVDKRVKSALTRRFGSNDSI